MPSCGHPFSPRRKNRDWQQPETGSILLGHKYETNLYLSWECETNLYEEERCQLGQLKLSVLESFSMCELRGISSTSAVRSVISHCWERKAGTRNWKHQPIMRSKSCLRCRRAQSFCYPRTAKPGGGSKGTVWEEKEWRNKGRRSGGCSFWIRQLLVRVVRDGGFLKQSRGC